MDLPVGAQFTKGSRKRNIVAALCSVLRNQDMNFLPAFLTSLISPLLIIMDKKSRLYIVLHYRFP